MSKRLYRILSVWLAIVLAAAPLPVFAAAGSSGAQPHCMRGEAHSGHASHDMAAQHRDHSQQAAPACRHCRDGGCKTGACADQGCSASAGGTLMMPAVFSASLAPAKQLRPFTAHTGLHSLTYPPLLRPPAPSFTA